MYLWLQLSEHDLDTLLSWKPGVHKGEGVTIPRDVEYSLSLNLKFLYPQPTRTYVVWQWFDALVRKAKIAYMFRNKPRDKMDASLGFHLSKIHLGNLSFGNTGSIKEWSKEEGNSNRNWISLSPYRPLGCPMCSDASP